MWVASQRHQRPVHEPTTAKLVIADHGLFYACMRYCCRYGNHNGIIREDDLYSWIISKEGKSKLDYESTPLHLVNEMVAAAKRYSYLVQATNSDNNADGVNKYPNVVNIGYINKQRSRQHLILLMALNLNCDDDVINYLAQQIESLFFANTLKMQTKTMSGALQTGQLSYAGYVV